MAKSRQQNELNSLNSRTWRGGGAHFKSFEVSSTRARLPRLQVDPGPVDNKQLFRDERRRPATQICANTPRNGKFPGEKRERKRKASGGGWGGRVGGVMLRESESDRATQWGAAESGREEIKNWEKWVEESVFILMCTQSAGSVSAIVPGLAVKTARLLQRRHARTP